MLYIHIYNTRHLSMTPLSILYLKVGYVGLAYCLVYTGFNVAQSFLTTLIPSPYGFISLSILYAFFALFSILAPFIVSLFERFLSARFKGYAETGVMVIGVVQFILYNVFVIVAVIIGLSPSTLFLLILASVLCGCGAGLMWVGQGVWLSKVVAGYILENHDDGIIGRVTGMFFTLFNLNGITGNVIVITLLAYGVSIRTTLWAQLGVLSIGAVMLLSAAKVPTIKKESLNSSELSILRSASVDTRTVTSFSQYLRALKNVISQPSTNYLVPYFLSQGCNIGYSYGSFPIFLSTLTKRLVLLTDTNNMNKGQQHFNIAIAFLLLGIGSFIGSFLWGYIYDRTKSRLQPLIYINLVLSTLNWFLLIGISAFISTTAFDIQLHYKTCLTCYMIIAFNFGLQTTITNSIINNSITRNYETDDVGLGFAWYRFCFCIGFTAISIISVVVPAIARASKHKIFEKYGWLFAVLVNMVLLFVSVWSGLKFDKTATREQQKSPDLEECIIDSINSITSPNIWDTK